MNLAARDIMRTEVRVVDSSLSLTRLERSFLEASVSGFPVVVDGKLVGIVSRSDIIRSICVEQSLSETFTYLHKVYTDEAEDVANDAEDVTDRVSERMERFTVADVMISKVISVAPDTNVADVARTLVEHHIHRVPVVEDGRLVGIISSLDLTRLVADGVARLD